MVFLRTACRSIREFGGCQEKDLGELSKLANLRTRCFGFRGFGFEDDFGFRPFIAKPPPTLGLFFAGEEDVEFDQREERYDQSAVANEGGLPISNERLTIEGHGFDLHRLFADALTSEEGQGVTHHKIGHGDDPAESFCETGENPG
jgi:hypothetical protein